MTIVITIFVIGEKLIHQRRYQNVRPKQYQNTRIIFEREASKRCIDQRYDNAKIRKLANTTNEHSSTVQCNYRTMI